MIKNLNSLNNLQVSARRGKQPRCNCCGELIDNPILNAVHVSIPHQKNGIYVHPSCVRTLYYHESTPDWFNTYRDKHLTTSAQVTFTPEVEGYKILHGMNETEHNAYMWGEYKLLPSEDCTVGVEYKSAISVNLHGVGQWFEGVARMVDMTPEECGLHFNTGWYGMNGYNVQQIYNSRWELLKPLRDYMNVNREGMERIWGRTFNSWACSSMECVHGDWINLEHRNDNAESQNAARIEWRLPHYVDARQAKQCACMVCDFTQILRSFCDGTRTAEQAGKLILKHYKQAEQGKATWQRPERNKD